MRKLYLVLSFILLVAFSSEAQSPVYKIAHDYFRSNPFLNEFSVFMTHLLNDPTLTEKGIEKKTDSSLFYFEGTYATHNPFFFKPTKVKVILTETPVKLDSIHIDTIYSYQLLAFDTASKEGILELKKEFEKIYHRYKNGFAKNSHSANPPGTNFESETYNFFDNFHKLAPFAITWFGPDPGNKMCLVLTIRLVARNNKAELPVPLYTP